jgi:hypothetical protein
MSGRVQVCRTRPATVISSSHATGPEYPPDNSNPALGPASVIPAMNVNNPANTNSSEITRLPLGRLAAHTINTGIQADTPHRETTGVYVSSGGASHICDNTPATTIPAPIVPSMTAAHRLQVGPLLTSSSTCDALICLFPHSNPRVSILCHTTLPRTNRVLFVIEFIRGL